MCVIQDIPKESRILNSSVVHQLDHLNMLYQCLCVDLFNPNDNPITNTNPNTPIEHLMEEDAGRRNPHSMRYGEDRPNFVHCVPATIPNVSCMIQSYYSTRLFLGIRIQNISTNEMMNQKIDVQESGDTYGSARLCQEGKFLRIVASLVKHMLQDR